MDRIDRRVDNSVMDVFPATGAAFYGSVTNFRISELRVSVLTTGGPYTVPKATVLLHGRRRSVASDGIESPLQ